MQSFRVSRLGLGIGPQSKHEPISELVKKVACTGRMRAKDSVERIKKLVWKQSLKIPACYVKKFVL